MAKHLVAVLTYDGLCTFEFGCVAEVFGLHRPEISHWYDFVVCGPSEGCLASTGGVRFIPPFGIEKLLEAQTIVIPGWLPIDREPPAELVDIIIEAHARGARIAAICSGAFLLGFAGLLDGRRATTHWLYADALARRFPKARVDADVLYIEQGSIITSAGSAAGIDMLLYIVRKDYGAAVCNIIARRMVVPPHREGGQAQFVARPVPSVQDSRLSHVIHFMRTHARETHAIRDLASRAAMSPRSFHRKFQAAVGMSPYEWLVTERVAIARELLEATRLNIDQVANEAGFMATETFRHHFRKVVGTSPAKYRAMYNPQAASGLSAS